MSKRPEVRFTLQLRPDTEDPEEALEDARDFIQVSREGWYSTIRVISEPEIIEVDDDE
jgi:hypothetical protein